MCIFNVYLFVCLLIRATMKIYTSQMELYSSLCDNLDRFDSHRIQYFRRVSLLLQTISKRACKYPIEQLILWQCREQCNSFGIWQAKRMIGSEMCFVASLFNHSCAPVMKLQQNGRRLTLCALQDIPAGTELCWNYNTVWCIVYLHWVHMNRK